MQDAKKRLLLPGEPMDLKVETRALLENSPEVGFRVVDDAAFVADLLWEEWGTSLQAAGMQYDRFLAIARGYANELRLWVVGERPWDHCVAGLAGRVWRRLDKRTSGTAVAASGVSR